MIITSFLIGGAIYAALNRKKTLKTMDKISMKKKSLLVKKKVSSTVIEKPLTDNIDVNVKLSVASVAIVGLSIPIPILQPIGLILLSYLSMPIFKSTLVQIKKKKKIVGNDMLFSLLISIGFISSQFLALTIALFFYFLGRKSLLRTQKHSEVMLDNLFTQQVEKVWLLCDNAEIEVPLDKIKKDDCIVVNTGDMIPIDGVVIEGISLVNQQALTGESQPVEKLVKDKVFASTQVMSGSIMIKVEKTGAETTVAKVSKMLSNTADYKVNMLTQAEEKANQIAFPLMALSVITMPFLGLVTASGVLNSTFGTRLQLIAPLSVLNHLNLAMKQSILVKDGRALESLSKVDTILFDKTGTLTEEEPTINRIIVHSKDYDSKKLLTMAAAAESKLNHPIAKAIIKKALSEGLVLPKITESDFHIGLGITVNIEDEIIHVGSFKFMKQNNIEIPNSIEALITNSHTDGNTIIFVASQNKFKGILELTPSIRPEVKSMIIELREKGIKNLMIVSGDHEGPTKKLSEELGMDGYFSEVMPEDKAKIVSKLQQEGRTVCFIGDGINDTIAIKQADVSISLEGATNIARDLAQVVFMDGSLKHLPQLFDIALSLEENMKKTLRILYIPVFINLSGAFIFHFGLMATVVTNNISTLLGFVKSKQNTITSKKDKKLIIPPNVIKISIMLETYQGEKRVSITPKTAKKLINLGAKVYLEENAGIQAGFTNKEYSDIGVIIAKSKTLLYQDTSIITWVKPPVDIEKEFSQMSKDTLIIGFTNPFKKPSIVEIAKNFNIKLLSLELMPHEEKINSNMNALAVMSRFAGKIALEEAIKLNNQDSNTILIIGAGSSGMEAARTVNLEKDKLIVISTSNYFQMEIENKLKSTYIKLPTNKVILDNEKCLKQQQLIIKKIIYTYNPNIIITTARKAGEPAPKLITKETLNLLAKNSIVMDLTASLGGNTPITLFDQQICTNKEVFVINKSNYPSAKAKEASIAYSECLGEIIMQKFLIKNLDPRVRSMMLI